MRLKYKSNDYENYSNSVFKREIFRFEKEIFNLFQIRYFYVKNLSLVRKNVEYTLCQSLKFHLSENADDLSFPTLTRYFQMFENI